MRHYPPKAPRIPGGTSWNGTRDRAIQARFRRYLLARDGPHCQACGVGDVELQAHHDTPSDGRMLCRPCHKEVDENAR
jgi:5-methylcytosine-specific restriction endonuclease McrA